MAHTIIRAKSQEPRATSDPSRPDRTLAPSALSCGRTLLTAVFALAFLVVLSGGNALAQTSVATDRAALVALYNATGGADWTDNTNWLSTEALSAWYGVTTDGNGRVTELDLDYNQLRGEIPAALGTLANLQTLVFYNNDLIGEIPAELGTLANLQTLVFSSNALSGEIPAELGNLANLQTLSIYANYLIGEIPAELGNLANLQTLSLYANDLSGEIPAELGNLANLQTLSLYVNDLIGEIPAELGTLANLQTLYLYANDLSGEIPAELGNLANLQTLSLSWNELSGEIPMELGNLANLQRLYLYANDLSGEIPAALGNLANLEILNLSVNGLSGEIQAALESLTRLQELYLNHNPQLTGTIPPELENLAQLRAFYVHGTGLCVPPGSDLQTWLATIDFRGSVCGGAPRFSDTSTTREVPENSGPGTDVGAPVAATGANDDTLTYTLGGSDTESFTIVSTTGQIRTKAALNFEAKSSYSVTVTVSDGRGGTDSINLTISITDVNEQPATPAAPSVSATSGSNTSLRVSWTAPGVNGGPALTGYDLQYRPGTSGNFMDGPQNVTATNTTIASLTAGTSYQVQVRALNGETPSEWSPSGTGSTTSPGAPGAPTLRATAGNRQVTLSWTEADAGGPAITGYEYRYRADVGYGDWMTVSGGGAARSVTVTSLATGTEYTFQVRARNSVGPGPESSEATATPRAGGGGGGPTTPAPGAVGNLTAMGGDGQVALSWTAPSSDGGAAITDYEYRIDGRDPWISTGSTETTHTVTGLDNGTEYTFEVRAVSGAVPGPAATVTAIPVRPNRPPAFRQPAWSFELPENRDGREEPVELGAVTAEDPDGDALTYGLVSGDRERFAVGALDGVLTYAGPGEDFEAEPNRYDIEVWVRDEAGAQAQARVAVTVTPVNEAPAAVDDEAETEEDREVVIAVLANDSDPDGDPLKVETVSAAAHGATRITADGGVAYTPERDYHGADRFTYVVSDGAGETATGSVTVTVTAANDAPAAVGVIPDQVVEEGGDAVTVDVTPFFDDVDGDVLTLRAVSSDAAVAAVTLSGAVLTVTPVAAGTATVTVAATDPGGLTVTQTFGVGVGDRLVRAVFEGTLAAMGRGHLASARMTLGRRVAARAAEPSRLTVMGRAVPLGTAAVRAEAERLATNWLLGLASQAGGSRERAAVAGERSGAPALGLPSLRESLGIGGGRSEDPLRGTNFLLVWGGSGAQEASPSRRWTLWGQGDVQGFEGEPTGASGYEGDVRTGYVGLDVRLTDRWLAGVALARSSGAGDWNTGSAGGQLTTTLTAIHPYVRWSDGATSVWTMVGGGRGTAENARVATGGGAESALELGLGLVEVRRALGAVGGGLQVGLRGDAAWARLSTEGGTGTLDALRVDVNQLRVGVDVAWPIRVGNALELAPFGEVHARRDGGAGEGGNGLELVGGLRVAGGIVQLDAQGRLLTLHSADGYRERGAGVTLSVGEGAGRPGLTLSMSPRWGARASSADALWQDHLYRDVCATGGEERALDGRVAYGVGVGRGRLLTPFAVYGQSQYGQRLQVGTRVGALGGMSGEPLQIEVSGERHTRPGSPAEHRMSLAGVITFGRP